MEQDIAEAHPNDRNPHVPKLVITANPLMFHTVFILQVYSFIIKNISLV